MLNPEVGELPGWRRGRETRELFALSGDIWDGEDNLIAVLALQEPRLERGTTEEKAKREGERVSGEHAGNNTLRRADRNPQQ